MEERGKKVCIVNNLYALLIYALICTKEEFNDTFYFFGEEIPQTIPKELKCHMMPRVKFDKNTYWTKLRKIAIKTYYRCFSRIYWPFLRSADIYGQDNLNLSSALVGNNTMTLLEDGMLNYTYDFSSFKRSIIKLIAGGRMDYEGFMGQSSRVKKILLTGLHEIPQLIANKVEIISIYDLWSNSTQEKKEHILNIFSLNADAIKDMACRTSILITQPLSEDLFISEIEKINLYRNLIKDIDSSLILIKQHPREKTNYRMYFPYSYILDKPFPFELFYLNGVKFTDVYTLFSTSVLSFPYKINIHFAGTSVHENLVAKFGSITLNNNVLIKN